MSQMPEILVSCPILPYREGKAHVLSVHMAGPRTASQALHIPCSSR